MAIYDPVEVARIIEEVKLWEKGYAEFNCRLCGKRFTSRMRNNTPEYLVMKYPTCRDCNKEMGEKRKKQAKEIYDKLP